MIMTEDAESIGAMMKAERWMDAIAAAKQGLADDPSNHDLLWNLGWAYFKLEQYEKAAHYLHEAIDNGPVKHFYYAALGAALSAAKVYDAAELWLLRAIAVRDSSLTRLQLALVYMKQDLAEAAEAVHKEGIRLRPDDRERLEAYADFLSDLGRAEEAEKMYEDAKKIETNR
jgi:tetratricopeptide (TPR) repeat protein